jgi:hypothetical protein
MLLLHRHSRRKTSGATAEQIPSRLKNKEKIGTWAIAARPPKRRN